MRAALLVLAALAVALPLRAQQLPVKGYGQELVDQVMAKERGLLVVVMHISPPGTATYPIIASNIGRIGKVADEDDMRVITTGKTNLEVAHGGARFEVEMPMYDLAGNTIGALGIVFPYRPGTSKAALEKKAVSIRDWLARRILDARSLVEPYPFEPLATTRTHAQKLFGRDAGPASRNRPAGGALQAGQGARLRHYRLEHRPHRDEGPGAQLGSAARRRAVGRQTVRS